VGAGGGIGKGEARGGGVGGDTVAEIPRAIRDGAGGSVSESNREWRAAVGARRVESGGGRRRELAAAGAHLDGNGVNKPAGGGDAIIAAAKPTQLNGLPLRGRRQVDDGGDEATGIAAPGL